MKKYIPIVVAGLVILGVSLFVRTYRNSQQVGMQRAVVPTGTESSVSVVPEMGNDTTTSRNQAISLVISSPSDNTTVSSPSLKVRGKTVPGAEVFVNDWETTADASGDFSVTLMLDEGENYILVVTNDAVGNFSEKELTIIYAP